MIVWILQFLIGFIGIGLVVLVHESGHFLAARALGVRVETFGIGMGPKIFSYQGKNTEYCISLIPFGGYCRMDGSIDLVKALRDEQKSFTKGEYGSYFTTTPLVRLLIFLAGPLANFLLSVILFLIVAMIPVLEAVHEPRVVVAGDYSQVFGTTLDQAEVESGDLILSVDGRAVDSYEEVEDILASADRPSIPVRVLREGQILDLTLYGQQLDGHWRYGIALWQDAIVGRTEDSSPFQEGDRILSVNGSDVGNVYDIYLHTGEEMDFSVLRGDEVLTVSLPSTTSFPFAWAAELRPMERPSLVEAVVQGFSQTGETIAETFSSLVGIFGQDTEEVRNEITGPTRAAQTIGTITTLGFESDAASGIRAFLYLLSVVSVSLLVANLLPIPTFDGGQIFLNIYQIVCRKELGPRGYVVFQILGIVCTVIIVVALYSLDVIHYFFR